MTKRIFRSICLVALSVFLASIVLFMGVLYDYFSDVQRSQLKVQTDMTAQGVMSDGLEYLKGLDLEDCRITWIDADGEVLFDSKSDAAQMENHLEREEIKKALSGEIGESSRYSATLFARSLYCAKRLPDGTVLRLSTAQNSLLTLLLGMQQPIGIIFAVTVGLSLLLAFRLSKKIVKPLNELNLDEPLNNDGYAELSPLLCRLDMQQRQIKQQSDELKQKQSEFEAVTMSMTEGIVLLNSKGIVLSINHAAVQLFGMERPCIGDNIRSVVSGLGLTRLLEKSGSGKYAEKIVELGGGRYQLGASPVISNGEVSGTVLLLLDVTEKESSEQMRREFTANVSHELKTPLHTISGCAELLANGMVKEADVTRFSTQIYTETQRMIRLVEDIIKLSHLDEGVYDMQFETVDLYALAESTIKTLEPEAKAAKVTLSLNGRPALLNGISQLLSGIVFNLCDNAIKYNRAGGSVSVNIQEDKQNVLLSVADTGIGIPPEHQERIFERFYRVDKSHSKEIGGTGLGLSIVKHAARLHNAVIELNSIAGRGTSVTVKFPKKEA